MNIDDTQIEDLIKYTNRVKRSNNSFHYDNTNYTRNSVTAFQPHYEQYNPTIHEDTYDRSFRHSSEYLNKETIKELKSEIERLSLKNQRLSESALKDAETIKNLKNNLTKQSAENASLKSQLSEQNFENSNFYHIISEKDEKIEELTSLNSSLRNKNSNIEREMKTNLDNFSKVLKKSEKYKNEVIRLNSEFKSMVELNSTLKSQIETLEKIIYENKILINDQKSRIDHLSDKSDIEDLESKLDEALKDCLNAMNELEKSDSENAKLIKVNSQLKKDLKRALSSSNQALADRSQFEVLLAELKKENELLKIERKKLKSRKCSSKVRSEEIAEITNKYLDLDRENLSLKENLDSLRITNSSLSKDIEILNNEVMRLKSSEKDLAERYNRSKALIEASNIKLQNRDQSLLKQSFEHELSKQKLQTALNELEKNKADIAALKIALRRKDEEKNMLLHEALKYDSKTRATTKLPKSK